MTLEVPKKSDQQPPLFPEKEEKKDKGTLDEAAKRGREVGEENEKERKEKEGDDLPWWQR